MVCGKKLFLEQYNYEVCSVCGRIDDWHQTENIFAEKGVNRLSLPQKRIAYNILNGKPDVEHYDGSVLWPEKIVDIKLYNKKIEFDECLLILLKVKDSKLDMETKMLCTRCICNVDVYYNLK